MRADQLTFVGLAMAVTALLTVLQWQSLFPSLRDCLALAGLPVTPRQIFLAKSGALLIVFAVFVLAMNTVPAFLFGFVTSGRAPAPANFAATAGGCVFVFFTLLACQGVLLNLLPPRAFARVSLFVQAGVFMATLGASRWSAASRRRGGGLRRGSSWSGGGSHRNALLAVTVPAVVAVVAYLFSYHRYRRLLLEVRGRSRQPRCRAVGARQPGISPRKNWRPSRSSGKPSTRSRTHRLILMAYAGLALGWITKGALDTPRPTLRDQGMYGLLITLAPLGIAMLITLGLRYLFSLPVTLPANWLFQTTGRDGRARLARRRRALRHLVRHRARLRGEPARRHRDSRPASRSRRDRARQSPPRSSGSSASYRDWRKLPFTCSYLPGKQPAWMLMLRAGLAAPLLAAAGQLILYCSADLTAFTALFTFELAVWWRLRADPPQAPGTAPCCNSRKSTKPPSMSLDLQPADRFEPSAPHARGRHLLGPAGRFARHSPAVLERRDRERPPQPRRAARDLPRGCPLRRAPHPPQPAVLRRSSC